MVFLFTGIVGLAAYFRMSRLSRPGWYGSETHTGDPRHQARVQHCPDNAYKPAGIPPQLRRLPHRGQKDAKRLESSNGDAMYAMPKESLGKFASRLLSSATLDNRRAKPEKNRIQIEVLGYPDEVQYLFSGNGY